MKELNEIKTIAKMFRDVADKADELVDKIESNPDMSEEEVTEATAKFIGHMMLFNMQMNELTK